MFSALTFFILMPDTCQGDDWGEESDTDGEGDDILDKLRRNFTSTLSQVGDQGKDVEKHKGR